LAATAALAFALLAASASADERLKPIAKVAPGVHLGEVSTHAKGNGAPNSVSGPGSIPEAKRDSGPSSKIVGGTPTTISEWPWQTAILFNESIEPGDGFDRQFCGGSLVAPTIVVSAAHCFFDVAPPPDANDNDFDDVFFDVVTGRTVLSSTAGQELAVDDYFVFVDGGGDPLFDGDPANGWDVVFIDLASPSSSQTIKVAGPGEGAVWAAGRTAFTTGWGALNEGPPQSFPDQLREVQISMISNGTCALPGVYGTDFIPNLMVCAGVLAGGKDSCQGDSGGPLVVPIAGGGFRLVGDTSFGEGCARPNKPGVYGRIADDPMRTPLANGIQTISGVNILGAGAQPPQPPAPPTDGSTPPPPPVVDNQACEDAQDALNTAKKKRKKAKRKLRKAKDTGDEAKIKRAKKKVKRAKKKVRKAKQAVEDACA
jgi:hypothetical protein